MGSVIDRAQLIVVRDQTKQMGKTLVFTNGCFDIIHRGHVEYLSKAKALGDILVVGLNSDASVQRLKGPLRPIVPECDRAFIVANLSAVDYVCSFEEDTPLQLITLLVPDILVKGADWAIDAIVGKEIVESAGGRVATIEFIEDRSTTGIIETILARFTENS